MSLQRPIILGPVDTPKSWGGERWLNSTRPEGRATLADAPPTTLADRLAAEPALLGEWARRLYGDELPIFTKFIHTNFPSLVHVGFRREVPRATLTGWLAREQELLRALLAGLRPTTHAGFDAFQSVYAAWATEQALARWQRDDEATAAARLGPLLAAATSLPLDELLGALRRNRSQIVDVLHEIDLRREQGNLLLTSAGVVHAIFGLSHQTHPLDGTRATLQSLFAELAERSQAGADDDELRARIAAADLPSLRARNRDAPPKNEAWLPAAIDGRLMLVEPQQTSDTTYSLADFYTPFVWAEERVRFRKGDPATGLSVETVSAYLTGVDPSVTSIDELRRVPEPLPAASTAQARLHRLVDEPTRWPFFTAYRLDLDGRPGAPARWRGDHPHGVFQQLVPLDGAVEIRDAHGHAAVANASAPAFIPATLDGGYELAATGAATVLVLSVPGARGGSPQTFATVPL
jgi:hypothetical protein